MGYQRQGNIISNGNQLSSLAAVGYLMMLDIAEQSNIHVDSSIATGPGEFVPYHLATLLLG